MDLVELRAYVRDYTLRSDLSDTLLNGFLSQIEAGFRRDLPRHRLAEKTTELSANTTTGAVSLPSDFREARSVQLDGEPLSIVSIDTRTKTKGTPAGYYVTGSTLALVPPPATSGGRVSLVYQALVPPLTDAAPSNWVLSNFPPVYVHALLALAYGWLKDSNAFTEQMSLYQAAVAAIDIDHRRSIYSGGTPIMPAGAGL